jgi:hypothetical protein
MEFLPIWFPEEPFPRRVFCPERVEDQAKQAMENPRRIQWGSMGIDGDRGSLSVTKATAILQRNLID